MSKKSINFDYEKFSKRNFYKNKKLLKIDDIDVNKHSPQKRELFGTKKLIKCFIGYDDKDVIRPP